MNDFSIVFPGNIFKSSFLEKIYSFEEVNDSRIYVNKSRVMISYQKGINILYILF